MVDPDVVAVVPAGVNGFDYLWLGIAVAMDLFTRYGDGYSSRTGP